MWKQNWLVEVSLGEVENKTILFPSNPKCEGSRHQEPCSNSGR